MCSTVVLLQGIIASKEESKLFGCERFLVPNDKVIHGHGRAILRFCFCSPSKTQIDKQIHIFLRLLFNLRREEKPLQHER